MVIGAAAAAMGGLITPRLRLCPIEQADLVQIAVFHRNPRIRAQLVDGIPDSIEGARAFVAWNQPMAAKGYGTFAVRRHGDAALLGLFSLTPFKGDEQLLELGGKLHPSAWAGKIAMEAAAVMIDHAFGTLGRERLVSAFDPANRSASAALARLGFENGAPTVLFGRDVSTMTLDRATWRARRTRVHP